MMDKKEFDMKKELIELKHKYKMEELETERKNYAVFHDKELEKIRIKSAEIRRSQLRKDHGY